MGRVGTRGIGHRILLLPTMRLPATAAFLCLALVAAPTRASAPPYPDYPAYPPAAPGAPN